jgi:hypothetical protein
MRHQIIGKCPVCENQLTVARLKCDKCETVIEGQFTLDPLSKLREDEMKFVEIFLKNRGSIKDVEKDLGVSYPTVRRMLDQVIESLGYAIKTDEKRVNRMEILEKLEKGEISSDEAMEILRG